jgi:hypothetical protein
MLVQVGDTNNNLPPKLNQNNVPHCRIAGGATDNQNSTVPSYGGVPIRVPRKSVP